MKKPLVVTLGVVIVAIVGGFLYLGMSGDKTADDLPAATSNPPVSEPPAGSVQSLAEGGKYIDYQAALIPVTPGNKILFFHAPWCPQCRQLEADIKAGPLPADTTIFKVDYDTNQTLRQKYGVTIQTTLVKVDDQGNLIEKYVAYDDPSLEAVKNNLL